ncbi:hypothetical protein V1515DRAFT_630969 [Lipomyces mesembrius]
MTIGRRDMKDQLRDYVTGQVPEQIDDAYMMSTLSVDEALRVLEEAVEYHADDLNFPSETLNTIELLLKGEEAYGTDHESYILGWRLL